MFVRTPLPRLLGLGLLAGALPLTSIHAFGGLGSTLGRVLGRTAVRSAGLMDDKLDDIALSLARRDASRAHALIPADELARLEKARKLWYDEAFRKRFPDLGVEDADRMASSRVSQAFESRIDDSLEELLDWSGKRAQAAPWWKRLLPFFDQETATSARLHRQGVQAHRTRLWGRAQELDLDVRTRGRFFARRQNLAELTGRSRQQAAEVLGQ